MKKLLSIIISICLLVNIFPLFAFAVPMTPEISLKEFASQLKALQEQYDDNYVGEIVFEDGSDYYHVDGELFPLENEEGESLTASVSESGINIPLSILADSSVEATENDILEAETKTSQKSRQTKNTPSVEDYASTLGYDVEINDDTAVFTQPYQTHRLIVKSKYNVDPLDSVAMVEGYNNLHVVQFDDMESTVVALEYYENQKRIEYVEPDTVVSILEYEDYENYVQTNVQTQHKSWGSDFIGIDDYIDSLGDVSNLPEIVVGIVDTGIELDHDFLFDRIIQTGFNVSGSGTENSENDDRGHGTHVAGIIVDNTTDNVRIKGYKVLNNDGKGTITSVCNGIRAAADDSVNVINMSLGALGHSSLMEEAVLYAVGKGIHVCVSAGNSSADAADYCPASIEECITVAALKEDQTVAVYSNYGRVVDLIAPGTGINSSYLDNSFKKLSGTSMAAPFASAACAMLLSSDTSLTTVQLMERFQGNTRYDWETTDLLPNCYALYLGGAAPAPISRTEKPVFSKAGGEYNEMITVEITCPEEADIYYTTNGMRATEQNGTLYTEPIVIDKDTTLHAVAIASGKWPSLQTYTKYTISLLDPESLFTISSNGLIKAYNGKDKNVVVPDTVNGITVTGIAEKAFYSKIIQSITLPDTATYIGTSAFENTTLTRVKGGNITTIADRAFATCMSLYDFDFSNVEDVGVKAFYMCNSITEIVNDKMTAVKNNAFQSMDNLKVVRLPNVKSVGYWAFYGADSLELIELPNVEFLDGGAIFNCKSLEKIDFPNLTELAEKGSQFKNCVKLSQVNVPNLEGTLPQYAFARTAVEVISLPKITKIDTYAFSSMTAVLKLLYIPKCVSIVNRGVAISKDSELTVFAPKIEKISISASPAHVKLYCSDSLNNISITSTYLEIIAPIGTYAYEWAIQNENATIDSYSMVGALGENIRAYDNGLRFNYSWNELEELNECAENISYGFEYSCSGSVYLPEATNKVFHSDTDTSSFNLVLSNIPNNKKDSQITARAVINIDGMIFKSPIQQCTYNDVYSIYSASISRNDINRDGFVNEDDINLLVQTSAGINSSRSNTADINNDGVVDGFDAAELDRTTVSESFIYLDDDNDNTLGDVNTDGAIDVADYAMVKQHVLCDVDLNGIAFANQTEDNTVDYPTKQVVCLMLPYMLADMDKDTAVDAFDLFYLDKRINDLI